MSRKFANVAREFETNPEAEREGIWESFIDEDGEELFALLIGRAGGANSEWERAVEKLARKFGKRVRQPTGRKLLALMRPLYARHVVLGWRGVKDSDGNEIPFSPSAAEELLKEFPDLYDEVIARSNDLSLFRKEQLEADSGN